MNEKLIEFIELCLMDGVVTDKEREVIFRKSKELGVSDDECEIILEGMIQKHKNQSSTQIKKKKSFFGGLVDGIKKNIDVDSISNKLKSFQEEIQKNIDEINKEYENKSLTSKKQVSQQITSSRFYSVQEVGVIVKYPTSMSDGRVFDLSGNRIYKISKTMRQKSFFNKTYLGQKEFKSGSVRWVEIDPDEVESKLNDIEFVKQHSKNNTPKETILKKPSVTNTKSEKKERKEEIERKELNVKDVVFEFTFKDYFKVNNKENFIQSFKLVFTLDEVMVLSNQKYHQFSKYLINPLNTNYFSDNGDLMKEQNKNYVGDKMISIIKDNKLYESIPDKIIFKNGIKSIKEKIVNFQSFYVDGSGFSHGEPPTFKFDDRYNRGGWFDGLWGKFYSCSNLEVFSLFNIPSRSFIEEKEKEKLIKSVNLILNSGTEKYLKYKSVFDKLNLDLINIRKNKYDFMIDSNIYFEVLKKNQQQIIEIDRDYVQKFIKLNNYLKEKSQSLLMILDKTILNFETQPKEELYLREKELSFFQGLLYSYNLLVNHSIVMLSSLIEDDMIKFYEVYEVLDKMNVFNTNWENQVNQKLSEINESLIDLNFSISGLMNQMRNMEMNVVKGLESIQSSIGSLETSVNNQLSETNSRLRYENLTNYYKKRTVLGWNMDWFDGPSD